jgi:hypothetical protein
MVAVAADPWHGRSRAAVAAVSATPDRDPHANARVCVEATPSGKEARAVFKYNCPICFMHYREIYKAACCNNYVCVPCALAHVTQRLSLPTLLQRMPVGAVRDVCCPSCNSEHVAFVRVHSSAAVRSYAESPATRALLEQAARRQQQQQQQPLLSVHTPDGNGPLHGEAGSLYPVSALTTSMRQRVLDFDAAALAEEEAEEEEALVERERDDEEAPYAEAENAAAADDGVSFAEQPDLQEQEERLSRALIAQVREATAAAGSGLPPRVPNNTPARVVVLRDVSNVIPPPLPATTVARASASATKIKLVPATIAAAPAAAAAPAVSQESQSLPLRTSAAVPAAPSAIAPPRALAHVPAPLPSIAPFSPNAAPIPSATAGASHAAQADEDADQMQSLQFLPLSAAESSFDEPLQCN